MARQPRERDRPPWADFLPYAHVDLNDWKPCEPQPDGTRPLRVVHAPSDPIVKGTRFVVDAVERLRSEGIGIELELVQGLSRTEARRAYESADLAIDQLLVGWYGGVAVEQMALARPVVCYVRDEDLRFVPPALATGCP